ncbi:MAG: MBL fold metallo-hydrolase [Candidatus Pacebacteria bacterium]|nr:MBL fold metallo-hydrolase [Candidatus Paceibacterota bacterium]
MSDLKIKKLTLGELNTNCYIIWDKNTLDAWIVDPADEGSLISEEIIREDLNVTKIILTHGHFDHILGLLEVKLNFPQAKIYLHKEDLFLVKTVQKRTQHWLKRQVDPVPLPDSFYDDEETIKLGNKEFKVIHTPGHTPGSVSLYCKEEKLLISGDTLFKEAIGRTDFKYSNHQDILKSLEKLLILPKDTKVISGHGPETNIGNEQGWLK